MVLWLSFQSPTTEIVYCPRWTVPSRAPGASVGRSTSAAPDRRATHGTQRSRQDCFAPPQSPLEPSRGRRRTRTSTPWFVLPASTLMVADLAITLLVGHFRRSHFCSNCAMRVVLSFTPVVPDFPYVDDPLLARCFAVFDQ